MYAFEILVGSTLGSAEYAADHLAEKLENAGFTATVHTHPSLKDIEFTANTVVVPCLATHGAGDYPDNFKAFAEALISTAPDLQQIKYSVIALGSKSYDQFCNAGRMIDRHFADLKAEKVGERLEICTQETPIPEDAIDVWFQDWVKNWL